jgi:methyl-accepting chemotaxis protein
LLWNQTRTETQGNGLKWEVLQMKHMKVSRKLIISFLLVVILAVIIGSVGIVGMIQINGKATAMYENNLVPLPSMSNVTTVLQRMRVNLREYALGAFSDSQTQIDNAKTAIDGYMATMTENLNEYETRLSNPEAEQLFRNARALYDTDFKALLETCYNLAHQGDSTGIVTELTDGRAVTEEIVNAFDKCMDAEVADAAIADKETTDLSQMLLILIIVVLVVAVIIAMFLALYISGLISKPLMPLTGFMKQAGTAGNITLGPDALAAISKYSQVKDEIGQTIAAASSFVERINEVSRALGTIADGDLTVELAPLSDKDTLGLSLQKMTRNLNSMFREIHAASSQVSIGSGQVSDGAQALAAGATQQAASIEELSGSIAEIAERTKGNAAQAEQAATLADTIKSNAEKGSKQMEEMMIAVKDINEANHSISKVIKTIDDIAFQTNILALNAAVEAARAGQHGKGFAVVADEVRNLASKSASAAKETASMIANSMEKAELGVNIAGETAASLSEIVSGINESNTLIAEIAKSSDEQAFSISQINTGVDQVAQVVQQNSATAEESAAASEEMSGQSVLLQQLISQFRLNDGSAQHQSSHMDVPKLIDLPGATGFALAGNSDKYGKY